MSTSWKQSFSKAITFSYDDGVTQDIHLIELLNMHRLRGNQGDEDGCADRGLLHLLQQSRDA